jgi:hypothetical protein
VFLSCEIYFNPLTASHPLAPVPMCTKRSFAPILYTRDIVPPARSMALRLNFIDLIKARFSQILWLG